jgi:hypothetical protein
MAAARYVSVLGLQPGEEHAGLALPARRAGLILCFTSFAVPQRGGLGTRHSKVVLFFRLQPPGGPPVAYAAEKSSPSDVIFSG